MERHSNVDNLIEALRTSSDTLSGIAQSLIPYYQDINEYDEKALTSLFLIKIF